MIWSNPALGADADVHELPETWQEWALYEAKGATRAAEELTEAAKEMLRTFDDVVGARGPARAGREGFRVWHRVARRWPRLGALDTEPRDIAFGVLTTYSLSRGFGELDFWRTVSV